MSDLINRQDAIDAIKTMPIVEAMGVISTLPSADASLMQDSYHHYNPPSISVKSPTVGQKGEQNG